MTDNKREIVRTSIRFDSELHGWLSDYVHAKKRAGDRHTGIEAEVKRAVKIMLSQAASNPSSPPQLALDKYPYPTTRREHEHLEKVLEKNPGLAERIIGYLDAMSSEAPITQPSGVAKKGRMGVMGPRRT